jgi:hypothetical protein
MNTNVLWTLFASHYMTWLDLTWLGLTWLDLAWLDLTWPGNRPIALESGHRKAGRVQLHCAVEEHAISNQYHWESKMGLASNREPVVDGFFCSCRRTSTLLLQSRSARNTNTSRQAAMAPDFLPIKSSKSRLQRKTPTPLCLMSSIIRISTSS